MPPPSRRKQSRRKGRSRWHWLLLVLAVAPLASLWYDRTKPTLFGFPFFYWSQMALIFVVWLGTLAVYLLTKKTR
jgi:hypothetical protein